MGGLCSKPGTHSGGHTVLSSQDTGAYRLGGDANATQQRAAPPPQPETAAAVPPRASPPRTSQPRTSQPKAKAKAKTPTVEERRATAAAAAEERAKAKQAVGVVKSNPSGGKLSAKLEEEKRKPASPPVREEPRIVWD